MYLKDNNIHEEVNFWRKNINDFKALAIGEPLFFLVKNEKGVKTEREVLGYGLFKRFEVLDINQTWERYKNKNGMDNKTNYLNKMHSLFKKHSGDIGCIILDNLKFFINPVLLSNLDINFSKSIVSGKGITDKEVGLIIENGQRYIETDFNVEKINDNYYNTVIMEGKVKYSCDKKYERDIKNRELAIKYHGTTCKICGFNFEKVYGERGKGFIEIHHINPLSTLKEAVAINPKEDLIPVCSNCHKIIHRKKYEILSIEQMKSIVNKNKL